MIFSELDSIWKFLIIWGMISFILLIVGIIVIIITFTGNLDISNETDISNYNYLFNDRSGIYIPYRDLNSDSDSDSDSYLDYDFKFKETDQEKEEESDEEEFKELDQLDNLFIGELNKYEKECETDLANL